MTTEPSSDSDTTASRRDRSRSPCRQKSGCFSSLASSTHPSPDDEVAGLPQIQVGVRFGAGTHFGKEKEEHITTSVSIFDGRADSKRFTMKQHGFQLVPTPGLGLDTATESAIDFYDADDVVQKFFPQVEKEVLKLCGGATKVFAFDHIIRDPSRLAEESARETGKEGEQKTRTRFLQGSLDNAHGDYTARSGRSRAEQLLAPYEDASTIEHALSSRFAMVNLWYPLETVRSRPLALCTWNSVSPRDVLTNRMHFKTRIGETYNASFSPRQKWVFFSEVTPQEYIMFKTFDSCVDESRFTLHSAVQLPEEAMSETRLPSRKSIEVRVLVLWGENLEHLARGFVPPHMCGGYTAELDKEVPKIETLSFGDEW